jgi:hypothetical protein
MITYFKYGLDGKLNTRIVAIDEEKALWQLGANEFLIEQDLNPDTQYIVDPGTNNTVTNRPLLSTVATWTATTLSANGTATVTLSGVPNPSNYSIQVPDGVTTIPDGVVTTGSLIFKTNYPGLYVVTIDSFPYQIYKQTITAT